jgi:hypothetical protein
MVLSTTDSIRNCNHDMSMGLKIPDFGFMVKNHCVFRGEETPSDSEDNPERQTS